MCGDTVLKVSEVQKYYGAAAPVKALAGVSFEVRRGEFLGIMGASGSGKTTLLNCIATIDAPTAGSIFVDGVNVAGLPEREVAAFRREKLGFVFQDCNLLDTLTVAENIALTLNLSGKVREGVDQKVKEVAEQLGISGVLDKFPYEISGGQKQRAACARALINRPQLILADEPTGALDSKAAGDLLKVLQSLNGDHGATILMVTHDVFSASFCGRILFLKDGKLSNELVRGGRSRREFFIKIMDVLALVGGDSHAL